MKLPSRPATHLTEAASWRLLQSLAPETWIVREVTERDYGIDAYIEITSAAGEITGDLISVQLKGTDSIEWKKPKTTAGAEPAKLKDLEDRHLTARSPSIATSTANYWERLPVPVFLFVADISAHAIYFAPVEQTIRREYAKLASQDSISFPLVKGFSLSEDVGGPTVEWFAKRERLHRDFVYQISGLVSHAESFHDFIETNQGRDSFMEVDADAHLRFRALYNSCRMAAAYLGIEWAVDSLQSLYKSDRAQFKDEYVWLHELTLDRALVQIESIFPTILRAAIDLIENVEGDYWRRQDPILHAVCSSNALGWLIHRMEDNLKRRQ
ncbi:DUF4365 domain-containing protein [Sinorhizobium meliloti]|uniref:DUF4365 domain-containing protein n=1 Tax=Rhizobium meliloti TaxID=382 RepID=UPI000FDA3B9F|nr:DUF4365 domain-containing protein [Sinorhizobium meliloti]MDW9775757.1 DUF4365 domain-containing protein [Sinorhizobium meliloti]MDW9850207.1 DUF4365 domain-containing protein [Sinorhizobium meliloti]MDX0147007.1 DUF4365 domain-containing protein [Sinorhizobium meliloti]MDX0153328.1 DUF4365 domain-containing protein [Sinorhizobium meliloti]MDX0172116.1 DUF4365 domain-containing protein [Sinorhizobium meliloti]